MNLAAGEKLAAPLPPRGYRRWYQRWGWGIAALLHVAVISLLLLLLQQRNNDEPVSQTGVSVVFEPGTQAPQAPSPGPAPTPAVTATTPPPPPPPPPQPQQQTAETQPEVNLNIPPVQFSTPVPAPIPQPPAAAPKPVRPAPSRPSQRYTVMNNMSFGSGTVIAPPQAHAQRGLNLNLAQSNADAVTAPDVTIQGHVGSNWGAGFNKWVYAHLYYPDEAIANNQQGTVTVTFTAHKDGTVTGLRMVNGSGSTFLDQAWFNIFAQNLLPPFPPGSDDSIQITATVRYELQ